MTTPLTPQLLNRVRMRQVALMVAIGQLRTLRAAATHLGMTQPAATKMLQELEIAMGQPLFDRVGRGLALPTAGKCVLAYFQGLQGHFDALTRELGEIEKGAAASCASAASWRPRRPCCRWPLIRLRGVHPDLNIEITVDTSDRLIDGLRRGDLDLAIGRLPDVRADELSFTAIAHESLSVVAAPTHPLAKQVRVTWADLQRYPWILQARGSPMRDVLEQEFRSEHTPLPKGSWRPRRSSPPPTCYRTRTWWPSFPPRWRRAMRPMAC